MLSEEAKPRAAITAPPGPVRDQDLPESVVSPSNSTVVSAAMTKLWRFAARAWAMLPVTVAPSSAPACTSGSAAGGAAFATATLSTSTVARLPQFVAPSVQRPSRRSRPPRNTGGITAVVEPPSGCAVAVSVAPPGARSTWRRRRLKPEVKAATAEALSAWLAT